jgi:hypothetical protein
MYELNCHLQDLWVVKLPQEKNVVSVDGKVTKVKCKVCSVLERQDKLLVLKLDSLWKHVSCRKATVVFMGRAMRDFYFLKVN